MPAPTARDFARFACPAGKAEAFLWDADVPGLGLRAYASGRRQWVAQYRDAGGQTRRLRMGDAGRVDERGRAAKGVLGLDAARDAARQALARVTLGHDPASERHAGRRAVRLHELVDDYLEHARAKQKARSFAETERHLRKHVAPLHHEAAASIKRADLARLLGGVAKASGLVAANRARAALSAMWRWALATGRVEGDNPVAHLPKAAEAGARERVLSDAELAAIWRCTDTAGGHDRVVRLLLLTGARREEVGGLSWEELAQGADGALLWTLPAARSKNRLPHEVPLGPLAQDQLPARRDGRALVFGGGRGGFSSWSASKARLDRRVAAALREAGVESAPWRLHDLRRTFSTRLHELGVEPHIIEAALNHVSGTARRGVAGVYNRATYRPQKAAALALWEAHVREVAGLPAVDGGKVVALRKAG